MGQAQQKFDQAVKHYDEAIELIKALDQTFQKVAFENAPGKRYDVKITLAQFDVILQAILLQQAVADGRFDRLEQQFIEKITDYGDLLTYIRKDSNGQLDLSWQQLASLDVGTVRKLADILPNVLSKVCDSFVEPLAIVDKAIRDIDFFDKLTDHIAAICAMLGIVDGDDDRREGEAAAAAVVELLYNRWAKVTGGR